MKAVTALQRALWSLAKPEGGWGEELFQSLQVLYPRFGSSGLLDRIKIPTAWCLSMIEEAPSSTSPSRRVPLRVLLLLVNLIILMTPVLALFTSRIYENILLRRANEALIQQGTLVASQWIHRASSLPSALFPTLAVPPQKVSPRLNHNRTLVLPPLPPVTTHSNAAPQALILAARDLNAALKLLPKRSATTIFLLSPTGHVLASSQESAALPNPSLHHISSFQDALQNRHIHTLHRPSKTCMSHVVAERDASLCLVVSQPIVHKGRILGVVLLSTSPISVMTALRKDTSTIAILIAILLGALLLQTWSTSRAIVQPIHLLVAQAKQLTSGDRISLSHVESPMTREVQDLSEALVLMAQTLDNRANYIKTFASSVSHEFKTPLASIRGAVELLEDHIDSMDTEERAHFLSMIDRHAERLQHLVHRLLELARADVLTPTEGVSTPLPSTLQHAAQRFGDQHPSIPLHIEVSDTPHAVPMSPEIFDTVVTNLLENARQHGPRDVRIQLQAHMTATHTTFTVSNTGAPIGPANAARIFDPFFTTARDAGGTGLGLSVVRALLQAHAGSIQLLDVSLEDPPFTTSFRVTLPRLSSTAPPTHPEEWIRQGS